MSQEEIMNFLDANPGKVFSAKEIMLSLSSHISLASVYCCLRKIVKRKEYYCIVNYVSITNMKGCDFINKKVCFQSRSNPVTIYGVVMKKARRKK